MHIEHLIDGKAGRQRRDFETVNPATQEVLAEVACRRRGRGRRGRRRREGGVSRPGPRRRRPSARKHHAPAGRPHRAARAGDLGVGDARHRPGDRPDAGRRWCRARPTTSTTSPRCARAPTATRIRSTARMLNYTLFHPVGVCALISPWNVPFMTATWKIAPCLAFGNTAVLKMSELSPITADAAGRAGARGGRPAGRPQRRARLRPHGRRGARPASGRARDLVHRQHRDRQPHRAGARGSRNSRWNWAARARSSSSTTRDWERALDAAVFMIFSNNGERCTAGSRILVQRSIYDRVRAGVRARASRIARRRPDGRGDDRRADDLARSTWPRCAATSRWAARRARRWSRAASTRRRCPRSVAQRQLRAADGVRRRAQRHEDRAGRDLRPGRVPDPVRRRGGRRAHRQRHRATGCRRYVWTENLGRAHRVARGHRGGHVLRQQPERARPAAAVRRHQGVGHRPRGRHVELRGVPRAQERLRVAGRPSDSALGRASSAQGGRRWASSRWPPRSRTCRRCTCRSCPGRTRAAGRRRSTATSRSAAAAARSAWTRSSCSTCTGSSTPTTTSTARRASRASTRATSCRTSSRTCRTTTRAIPGSGSSIGEARQRRRASRRAAHADTTLDLEYGTLVPMRYMNADRHFKVVSVAGWCNWHDLRRQPCASAPRCASAIEQRYDGTVAILASGSLSHHFADNGTRRGVHAQDRTTSSCARWTCAVVELWRAGDWRDVPRHAADVRREVLGRGRHARHGDAAGRARRRRATTRAVEIITPYFGSSGTGQINAIFPRDAGLPA